MSQTTRIQRRRKQSPAVAAKERAKRARFQKERPGLAELVASGEYSEPVSQGRSVIAGRAWSNKWAARVLAKRGDLSSQL